MNNNNIRKIETNLLEKETSLSLQGGSGTNVMFFIRYVAIKIAVL
jgi:hypothetical protein